MRETILWIGKSFLVPDGYKKVYWKDLEKGQKVWIAGTNQGEPYAYGPHYVEDITSKSLRNSRGMVFIENTDGVLVEQ